MGQTDILLAQSTSSYSAAGQLLHSREYVIEDVSGVATATDYFQTSYSYDGMGRLVKTINPDDTFSKSVYNDYTYNSAGLVDSQTAYNPGAAAQTTRYLYAYQLGEAAGGSTVPDGSLLMATVYPTNQLDANDYIEQDIPLDGVFASGEAMISGYIGAGLNITVGEYDDVTQSWSTADLTITGSSQLLESLTINPGSTVTIASGTRVLRVKSLTIASGGLLDINDNALVIDYSGTSSPADDVEEMVDWNDPSPRIISTSGLSDPSGVVLPCVYDNGHEYAWPTYDTLASQQVSGDLVIVKAMYAADINFDGDVNVLDYCIIDTVYLDPLLKVEIEFLWQFGDLNYDGTVDVLDYNIADYIFYVLYPNAPALPVDPGTSFAGDIVSYTYNDAGLLATKLDQRGVKHTYSYDALNRLVSDTVTDTGPWDALIDDSVLRVDRAYDSHGRLVSLTSYADADGTTVANEVEWAYDKWGNVSRTWQSHGGAVDQQSTPSVQYGYTDGPSHTSGSAIPFVRPESVTYPGGRVVEYDYGQGTTGQPYDADRLDYALGRVSRITETVGQTTSVYAAYSYLGDGTIVSVSHPEVDAGLRLTVSAATGTVSVGDAVYEFSSDRQTLLDGRGTVIGVAGDKWWISVTAGTWDTGSVISKESDTPANYATVGATAEAGALTLTYGEASDANGGYAGLDRFGRVVDQRWTLGGTAAENFTDGFDVDRFGYGYDRSGNRTFRENTVARAGSIALDEFYSYDALDRLTNAQRGLLNAGRTGIDGTPAFEQDWTLDQLGNWTSFDDDGDTQTRTFNEVNEILTISGQADPSYDAAGNLTFDGTQHYTYDAWGRLAGVFADDTSTGEHKAGNVVARYRYDGRGYRVSKAVGQYTGTTITGYDRTDYYYNEGWQVLEERFSDGQPLAITVATTPHVQWLWDQRYIDSPALRWRDMNADGDFADAGDEVMHYTTDANANVTALVASSGDAAERYVYAPYGQTTVYDGDWSATRSESSYASEVLFAGYYSDPESGLRYARNRHYHDTLGRWLQRDPAEADENLTRYVHNNPILLIDPFGTEDYTLLPRKGYRSRPNAKDDVPATNVTDWTEGEGKWSGASSLQFSDAVPDAPYITVHAKSRSRLKYFDHGETWRRRSGWSRFGRGLAFAIWPVGVSIELASSHHIRERAVRGYEMTYKLDQQTGEWSKEGPGFSGVPSGDRAYAGITVTERTWKAEDNGVKRSYLTLTVTVVAGASVNKVETTTVGFEAGVKGDVKGIGVHTGMNATRGDSLSYVSSVAVNDISYTITYVAEAPSDNVKPKP